MRACVRNDAWSLCLLAAGYLKTHRVGGSHVTTSKVSVLERNGYVRFQPLVRDFCLTYSFSNCDKTGKYFN